MIKPKQGAPAEGATDNGRRRKVVAYAGPHYGRPHLVVGVRGRTLVVMHPQGEAFEINSCDAEELS